MTEKKSLLIEDDHSRGSDLPSNLKSSKSSEEFVSDDSDESMKQIQKKAYTSNAADQK